MDTTTREDRSLSSLVSDLTRETSELMRKEVELGKAEISDKITQVQHSMIALAIGAALILVGLFYVLDAVVYGLAELLPPDLSPWLSALVVGVIVAIVGYVLLKKGQHDLEPENLAPTRTTESLQKDKQMLEEKI
jgi:drug/metabolite transporter (DMT)-like permease